MKTPKIILITGGKGGVGKSLISANLAVTLAKKKQKVLLFDADLGLANIDILLKLQPKFHLGDLLNGHCTPDQVLLNGPHGVEVIPASSGDKQLADCDSQSIYGLLRAFTHIKQYDFLIIDCPAGIGSAVSTYASIAHDISVVVCDEPTSITDAYALIKGLNHHHGLHQFNIITNRVVDIRAGQKLFYKFQDVTDRFLNIHLRHAGVIVQDKHALNAVIQQKPICDIYPNSPAVLGLQQMAFRLTRQQRPQETLL